MNFKHGFYSNNPSLNPDMVMISNAKVKLLLQQHAADIRDVAEGKIVKPGVTDLVVRLLDCALPNHPELLPASHIELIEIYYQGAAFNSLQRHIKDKTLEDLINTVESFR